jgi:thioredoxin 1
MKVGNIVLSVVGVILAGFAWAVYDMSRPSPVPTAASGRLGAVLSGSKPVLLEFYADWCGPCQSVGPEVEKLAVELRGKAEVVRLNIDENRELAAQYGVKAIPCFIAFKRGKETEREVGGIPRERMRSLIGL